MTQPHIDWESLVENTEFDHVMWRDAQQVSFYQRQVFGVRAQEHEEEREESIAP